MLLLGDFLFEDFEIPETVRGLLSGKQMLAVKKQIGGQRVIDAMGDDPADVSWSGRFQGGDIVARAQELASMRAAAQPVTLVCDAVVLTVVIEEFKVSYERPYQGVYDIKLMVQPAAAGAAAPSLDDVVSSDLDSAASVLETAAMIAAAVTKAFAALQSAVAAAGTLANASPTQLAPVANAASATLAAIDAQAETLEETIDQSSFGGIVIGMDVPAMVTTFVGQAQDALDLSTLQTTRGYVARIAANVANASAATPAVITGP